MKTKTLVIACLLTAGAGSVAFAHPGRHGGPREWLERADSNRDGKVTLAEVNTATGALFDQADANHDGRVTTAEQQAFHQQMRAKFQADRGNGFAERLANRDANKDGKLSAEEVGRMPAGRFAKLDANKDGYLSKDELAAAAKHSDARRGEHGAKRLERVDENHDGAIDRNELRNEVQRHFSRMDGNGDGSVSGDELGGKFGGRGTHRGHGERSCDHDKAGAPRATGGAGGNGTR
jgi:hypothetical protein